MDDPNSIEGQVGFLKGLFGRLRKEQQDAPGGAMGIAGQGVHVLCQMLDGIIVTLSAGVATDEELIEMANAAEGKWGMDIDPESGKQCLPVPPQEVENVG